MSITARRVLLAAGALVLVLLALVVVSSLEDGRDVLPESRSPRPPKPEPLPLGAPDASVLPPEEPRPEPPARWGSVPGCVVNRGRLGVGGVDIDVTDLEGNVITSVRSDERGEFVIELELPVAEYPRLKLVPRAPRPDFPFRLVPEIVGPGDGKACVSAMLLEERRADLTVTVRNLPPDAEPLDLIHLVLLSPDGDTYDWRTQVRRPRQRIRDRDPGIYSIVASCGGYTASAERIDMLSRREVEIDLELQPGRAIRGRLVDETGMPVEGADVLLTYDPDADRRVATPGSLFDRRHPERDLSTRAATTDENGFFSFEGASRSRLWLRAYAGSRYLPAVRVPDSSGGQGDCDLGDLTMSAAHGSVVVALREGGRLTAVLCGLRTGWRKATVSAETPIRFDSVPPGEYLVFAGHVSRGKYASLVQRRTRGRMIRITGGETVRVLLVPDVADGCEHGR